MKLLNSLLLAAGLSLAGSAIADCGSCCASPCAPAPKPCCSPCSSSCWPCFSPCDWNPVCHNFSLGAGATYGTSGHLHGWGGFIEGNYNFCGNHSLGLQLTVLEEKGKSSGEQLVPSNILGIAGNPFNANVKQNRQAKLEQFLLMVNYTYHGSFADFSCWDSCCLSRLNYYIGGGVGLNFARTDDQINQGYYDGVGQLIPGTGLDSKYKKKSHSLCCAAFYRLRLFCDGVY